MGNISANVFKLKASSKKISFKAGFEESMSVIFLIEAGREFHDMGATVAPAITRFLAVCI